MALHYNPDLDFRSCYDYLLHLNTTVFNNQTLYDEWNANHTFHGDPRKLNLTDLGCNSICGRGFHFWPFTDTMERLFLWVLPGIILITHFQFAPLGHRNLIAVIIHLIGDPGDSLRSLLTRHEMQRQLCKESKKKFGDSSFHKSVATVLAAYEELGHPNILAWLHQMAFPDMKEKYLILKASCALAANRLESMLTTWVAILTLVGALITATIRTIEKTQRHETRIMTETAPTIAVLCLLFIFVPLVKFSGDIGAFASTSFSVAAIETLDRELKDHRGNSDDKLLLPPLDLQSDHPEPHSFGDYYAIGRPERVNLKSWPNIASYSGMNSSWRPDKTISVECEGRGKYRLLIYSLIFLTMGACVPAIFLSATNNGHVKPIAIGCRTFSWILVLLVWLVSLGTDFALPYLITNNRKLWRWTIVKDTIFASFVILIIVAIQLGLYNSCYCRGNKITFGRFAFVYLIPYTPEEFFRAKMRWVFIPSGGLTVTFSLILLLEFCGGKPRGPLCRSRKEMQEDLEILERMRNKIEGCEN